MTHRPEDTGAPRHAAAPLAADARAEATQHIQEHSLGEAARIGRLSRIREFVLGAQDGLLVPLGVVTGMAAAHPARSLIIVAGLAEAVAGAVSMGGGSYLASQAEEQLYVSEIPAEGREIDCYRHMLTPPSALQHLSIADRCFQLERTNQDQTLERLPKTATTSATINTMNRNLERKMPPPIANRRRTSTSSQSISFHLPEWRIV